MFASEDMLMSQGKRRSVKRGLSKNQTSASKRLSVQQTVEEDTSEEDDEALFVI